MKLLSFLSFIVLACTLCLPVIAHAQIDGPGGDPANAPIDGGLSILLATGVVYGVKKMNDSRKNKKGEKTEE